MLLEVCRYHGRNERRSIRRDRCIYSRGSERLISETGTPVSLTFGERVIGLERGVAKTQARQAWPLRSHHQALLLFQCTGSLRSSERIYMRLVLLSDHSDAPAPDLPRHVTLMTAVSDERGGLPQTLTASSQRIRNSDDSNCALLHGYIRANATCRTIVGWIVSRVGKLFAARFIKA